MKVKIDQTIEKEVDINFPVYFCEHLDFHKMRYGKIDGYVIERITIIDTVFDEIYDVKIEKFEVSDLTHFITKYIYNRSYKLKEKDFNEMRDRVIEFLKNF